MSYLSHVDLPWGSEIILVPVKFDSGDSWCKRLLSDNKTFFFFFFTKKKHLKMPILLLWCFLTRKFRENIELASEELRKVSTLFAEEQHLLKGVPLPEKNDIETEA